ncbi:MAG: flagellar hook-length control protein FliK [Alphaproteobacteria bacterium]|nr:flagellar hook-length control protein FliK [Alphaproteobacteria bacterium]
MSNAVRGTSGAQGGGGLAVGGNSSSRAAPADGAAFGGVLGQAMAGPAHPVTSAADGKADGKSDDKGASKGRGSPVTTEETAAPLTADLAPAVAGGPITTVTAATGKDAAPGATGGSDKKRRTDTATATPTQNSQAAAAVAASLVTPAVTGTATPMPVGAAAAIAVGAAASVANATVGAPSPRAATGPVTAKPVAPIVKGANTLTNHQLVESEDGTGSQEPDGIGPASATVGRPAALNSSVATTLSSGSGAVTTANTPAGGTGSRQPSSATTPDVASSISAPSSTVVLATLATTDRNPNQASPNGTAAVPASVAGTSGQTVTPDVMAANLTPLALPSGQTAPVAANSPVNVIAPDGTNQPLANALGSQILSMVAAGRNQITVHLSPPDLGALTVHVEVQSRDVSAWFASPQPQVQQAVNDALAQLHGSLSGAGLNLSGAWVGADVSGGGNGRPAATPLSTRRIPMTTNRVEAASGSTNSVEGLSVYA